MKRKYTYYIVISTNGVYALFSAKSIIKIKRGKDEGFDVIQALVQIQHYYPITCPMFWKLSGGEKVCKVVNVIDIL